MARELGWDSDGVRRLACRTEGGRADRRYPSVRVDQLRAGGAHGPRLRRPGGRLQRTAAPGRAAPAGAGGPPGVDRRQPADDAPVAGAHVGAGRDRAAPQRPGLSAAFGHRAADGSAGGCPDGDALPTGARPVRPGAARRLGPAPAAAAGPEPGPGGGGAAARPRRTGAVGNDPRDHPRGPVLGGAVAARAPRRADHRADRRPRGERQLHRRRVDPQASRRGGPDATSSSGPAGESCCG